MKRLRDISDNFECSEEVETKGRSDNPIRCASGEVRSPLSNYFAYMHALETDNDSPDEDVDQVDILDLIGTDTSFEDAGFAHGNSYEIKNFCSCSGFCVYSNEAFSFYKFVIPRYSVALTVVTKHPVLFVSAVNNYLENGCGFYRYMLTDKFHHDLKSKKSVFFRPSDGPFSVFSDYLGILAINWNKLMHTINGNIYETYVNGMEVRRYTLNAMLGIVRNFNIRHRIVVNLTPDGFVPLGHLPLVQEPPPAYLAVNPGFWIGLGIYNTVSSFAGVLAEGWNKLMHSVNGNMEEDEYYDDTDYGTWEGLTGSIPGQRLVRSTSLGNVMAIKPKGPGIVNNSRLYNNGVYGNLESDEGEVGFDRGLTEDDYLIGVPPNLNKIGQVIGTNKYHQKRATNLREKQNFLNKNLASLTDKSKFIKGQTKQFYSKVSMDGDMPLPGTVDVGSPSTVEECKKVLNMITKYNFLPRYEYTIESDDLNIKPRSIFQRFYKFFRNVTNSPFAPVMNAISSIKMVCSAVVATFVGKLMNSLFDFKNNLIVDSEMFRLFIGLIGKLLRMVPVGTSVKLCCAYLLLCLVYKLLQCSYYRQFRTVTTIINREDAEALSKEDDPRREREKFHDGVHNPTWVEFYEERTDIVKSGIEIPILGKFLKSNSSYRLPDSEVKIAEKENVLHMLENKNVAPTLSPIAVMNRLSASVTVAPFVKVDRSKVLADNIIANSSLLATAINFHSRCKDLNDAFNVGFPMQGPIRLVQILRKTYRPYT